MASGSPSSARRAVWGLFVTLGLVGMLGAPPRADATCPTFDIERTVLGFMGLAFQGRLTPADREAIMKGGVIPGVPVSVWPSRGPAPLRVGVIWFQRPQDPLTIELDADGDGVPEVVDTREENFGHTYTRPGNYAATLRVRDRQGRFTTYASPVSVMSPAAFEAELQGRWATFKAALQQGDLDTARECVQSNLRDRLEPDLRALLRQDVERRLPPIRFVEVRVIEALCVGLYPIPGERTPPDVRFVIDHDGVWRLARLGEDGE